MNVQNPDTMFEVLIDNLPPKPPRFDWKWEAVDTTIRHCRLVFEKTDRHWTVAVPRLGMSFEAETEREAIERATDEFGRQLARHTVTGQPVTWLEVDIFGYAQSRPVDISGHLYREMEEVFGAKAQEPTGFDLTKKNILRLSIEPEEGDEVPAPMTMVTVFRLLAFVNEVLEESTQQMPKGLVTTDGHGSIRIEWWAGDDHCVTLVVNSPHDSYVFLKNGKQDRGRVSKSPSDDELANHLLALSAFEAE